MNEGSPRTGPVVLSRSGPVMPSRTRPVILTVFVALLTWFGVSADTVFAVEPVPYDLERVVVRALAQHLGVRVSRLQLAVAERQATQQRAVLKPSLSVTATPNWFEMLVPDTAQLSNIPQKLQSGRGHSVTFNGSLPLWRSPLQQAVADAADLQLVRAAVEADQAAAGAIMQSIDAYFAVMRAEAALRTAKLSLQETAARLREIEARVQAGTATNIDRLQVEAERYGAEAQVVQARGEVTASRMLLNLVLGFDLNVPLQLAFDPGTMAAGPSSAPAGPSSSPEVFETIASDPGTAATLKIADALRSAEQSADAAKAYAEWQLAGSGATIAAEQAKPGLRVLGTGKWPEIELTLGVDRHGYLGGSIAWSQTYLADELRTSNDPASWFAGFELQWNLFDGGKQRAEVEAAQLQAEQAELYYEHVVQTARTEVMAAHVRWQAAEQALPGAGQGVAAAQQGLMVAQQLARAGAATEAAVLRAQVGLARAQQGYLDALYGATMAHSAYLQATGELVPYWQRLVTSRP